MLKQPIQPASLDLHFDVYFHTKQQQQWCRTTVSAQCWDCSGSLKVLEFWEVLSHPQIRRMSPAVPVARCCWQRHPSVPVQSWEVRQEKLLNWFRLQWEMSSSGECPRFCSSFTILLEPLQMCPGTALGQLDLLCGMDNRGHALGFPLHAPLGLKARLEQPGLSSAGSTRKCAALWGGEAKPVLQQIRVLYLQPPLWADRSGIMQVANWLFPLCVSLLPSPSSWMSLHWFSPPCSLSFTTINKLATHFRGTLDHPWRTFNLSTSPFHTQLGASGSLKPANWKCEAEGHVRVGNYSHWHSV